MSSLYAKQTDKEIHKMLKHSAESVNKYLPNKINKYLEASHNEVKGMSHIAHYYTYSSIEPEGKKEIDNFQNKIIYDTCSDEYRRGLMKDNNVSYKYDFMDEYGRLTGFTLDEEQCIGLGINIK